MANIKSPILSMRKLKKKKYFPIRLQIYMHLKCSFKMYKTKLKEYKRPIHH